MDRADQIANGDQPVVQEAPADVDGDVEIIWPEGHVTVLDETVAMSMFAQMMRVVTGETLDWSQDNNA